MADGHRAADGLSRLVNATSFVTFNAALFLLMCYLAYWDRLVQFRGSPAVAEFFCYAALILAAMVLGRFVLKGLRVPAWVYLVAQVGILSHFAGGLGAYGGQRLYDTFWLGIRYDKYVHAYNALVGAVFLSRYRWPFDGISRFSRGMMIVSSVLGFGAVIEIAEYLVASNVPHNGVGDYDNNMQDLVANALGASFWMIVEPAVRRLAARAWRG